MKHLLRNTIRTITAGVFMMLFSTITVEACSCNISLDPIKKQVLEAKRNAAAVFVGRVVEIIEGKTEKGEPAGYIDVVFKVTDAWKGIAERVTVRTANVCCICGFPFQLEMEYLDYADAIDGGVLATGACSRTKNTNTTSIVEDRKYLGKSVKILAPKSLI